jgi:phospholipid-transporting ATPase
MEKRRSKTFLMTFKSFLVTLGLATREMNRTFVPEGSRKVYMNDPIKSTQTEYLNNSVSTGKYTFVSFFPKFLVEFFSKYANLFFLFTGSIQVF